MAFEVQDPSDGLVEQFDVVTDDEERAAVLREEAKQPVAGVVVEVVGGLVEQQDVAATEQDARELDPPSLST
jgi:hypothetical protein